MTERALPAAGPTAGGWFKSSYSGGEGNECVEVADLRSRVQVRDSKDPCDPVLSFPAGAWTVFVADVKAGVFDDRERRGCAEVATFHSWDDVKREVFDADDLDEIEAGAQRMVAEARSWVDRAQAIGAMSPSSK